MSPDSSVIGKSVEFARLRGLDGLFLVSVRYARTSLCMLLLENVDTYTKMNGFFRVMIAQ